MTGKFITLEGGEGAGKSTQAKAIAKFLEDQGLDVLLTREPGGNPSAEKIRELLVQGDAAQWTPKTEALLMYAARVEHWGKTLKPALESGKWIVCDRFADSTVAYQGYGHGLSLGFLENLHQHLIPDATPDRTYFFDITPDEGLARTHGRESKLEHRFETMGGEFHQRVYQGFQKIVLQNPGRCVTINALQDIDSVTTDILGDLKALI